MTIAVCSFTVIESKTRGQFNKNVGLSEWEQLYQHTKVAFR